MDPLSTFALEREAEDAAKIDSGGLDDGDEGTTEYYSETSTSQQLDEYGMALPSDNPQEIFSSVVSANDEDTSNSESFLERSTLSEDESHRISHSERQYSRETTLKRTSVKTIVLSKNMIGVVPSDADDDEFTASEQLLDNEKMTLKRHFTWVKLHSSNRHIQGKLNMTTYRIIFAPEKHELELMEKTSPSTLSWLSIPLGTVEKIERDKNLSAQFLSMGRPGSSLVIYCKDARTIQITIENRVNPDEDFEKVFSNIFQTMYTFAFPFKLKDIWALSSRAKRFPYSLSSEERARSVAESKAVLNAQLVDEIHSEYRRMGVSGKAHDRLRFTDANRDYTLCDTYAPLLVVPSNISDIELKQVANFRGGRRLMALSWTNSQTGACIWRSSQPKAGISGSNASDEKFIEAMSEMTKCNLKMNFLSNFQYEPQ